MAYLLYVIIESVIEFRHIRQRQSEYEWHHRSSLTFKNEILSLTSYLHKHTLLLLNQKLTQTHERNSKIVNTIHRTYVIILLPGVMK